MQKDKKKKVTIEKASRCTDLILQNMELDELYPWSEWWSEFIGPIDTHPLMSLIEDKHNLKKLINYEFAARKLSNRLFVGWNKGIYMLDGDTAVASKFFLDRVKKLANSVDTTEIDCRELAMANGLKEKDSRMLNNAIGHIDGTFSTLGGVIGRMTSLPKQVKLAALVHFGFDL